MKNQKFQKVWNMLFVGNVVPCDIIPDDNGASDHTSSNFLLNTSTQSDGFRFYGETFTRVSGFLAE
jgi:hypothetical protein